MKYCEKCGKELADDVVVCIECGCSARNITNVDVDYSHTETVPEDAKKSRIFGIISCLSVLLLWPANYIAYIAGVGFMALVAVVFSVLAIFFSWRSKTQTKGYMCKHAQSGFWCGIVAMIGVVLYLVDFFEVV